MAAEKGLKGLAITEHSPKMPGTCHIFYFQNLRVVPRTMYGIELLLGTELNIMNEQGEVDLPQTLLKEMDIAIASMHTPCYEGEKTTEKITNFDFGKGLGLESFADGVGNVIIRKPATPGMENRKYSHR